MKRLILLFAISVLCVAACMRRPLSDVGCQGDSTPTVTLAVSVDWSLSRFEISDNSRSDEDYIHRVTFRFFPLDGSAAFDRYLEDNVESGEIEVPAGEYSVVVFNESIYDVYWEESIRFEDVDHYALFAAEIVDGGFDDYDFYSPQEGESLGAKPLKLASASVDNLLITEDMCTLEETEWSSDEVATAAQLNPIAPRPLTCYTTVEVATTFLSSASEVVGSLTGLAHRVFMASGATDSVTVTHISSLSQVVWDDESEQHGTISESFLTFTTPAVQGTHTLTLDVILTTGARHSPQEEMVYDVSDQILSSASTTSSAAPATRYADQDLSASVELTLPEVTGDVEVNDWGDETVITIQ